MNFNFFNFIIAERSAQLGISPSPEWMGSRWHHCPVVNTNTKKAVKGQGIIYFFYSIVAGRSAQLGISPPPEWMGSRRHNHSVADINSNWAVKGQGKKPHPPHLLLWLSVYWIILFYQFYANFGRAETQPTHWSLSTRPWGKCCYFVYLTFYYWNQKNALIILLCCWQWVEYGV